MTFAEIQAAVELRLIDTPTSVVSAIPGLINGVIKDLQREHNYKTMEATLSATTVIDTRLLVAKPALWKEQRGRPYMQEDLGSIRRMATFVDENSALMWHDNDCSSEPEGILIKATTIEVYPLPDGNSDYTDGEYRLVIPYYAYTADLSDGTDTNWFTDNAGLYIVERATAEGFAINEDEGRAEYWDKKADKRQRKLILADKYEQLSGTDTLAINDGPDGPYGER